MKKKRLLTAIILLILVATITIGYSILSTTLNISGTSGISSATWNIYFDNVDVLDNSVDLSTGDSAATINPSNATQINYTVTLTNPGDEYEFLVDVVNDGTIDAMIGSISSKLNNVEITTLPDYLEYFVKYEDGRELQPNQQLLNGEFETLDIYVGYKKDITEDQLPAEDQTLSFSFELTYVQANDNAVPVRVTPVSFAEDDWSTIQDAVLHNSVGAYSIGDTKDVEIEGFGTHTVRIVNINTPEECNTPGFSQTACGFVVEFEDVITDYNMNTSNTNVGGWRDSSLRTYLNGDLYNALPADLRNAITSTTVVSSHSNSDGTDNFTTTDKLYLLSSKEIWDGGTGHDTADATSRQLDFYGDMGITVSNYSGALKRKGESNAWWWTRSVYSDGTTSFIAVSNTGASNGNIATYTRGISPAFRIG